MTIRQTSQAAADTTSSATHKALDHIESAIDSTRDSVQPALARLASQAESVAKRSLDAVRDGAGQVRDRAASMGDATVRYVKDEPVKAVLIAAATGAALMALLSLIQSARRNQSVR